MSGNQVTGAVDRATDSPWFQRGARAGHAVSGLVHLLIAYIVVRLALLAHPVRTDVTAGPQSAS
ncbi:hypothetical protein QEN42_19045 [Gordonia alkanivorans]|uniref:hypothetical protein n=1 Tax=Gordonia alkanivorans TaxID=84096 RepID=UPI00244C68E0|nr:hypothetical protein [Gordonia alkanivorans]MDH3051941.1 hypothetical protein [Gordonia alkanivorans]